MNKEAIIEELGRTGYFNNVKHFIKQFCAPVFFKSHDGDISQGSMTFIKDSIGHLGITAKHVANKIDSADYAICQIGATQINPISSLSCSNNLDIATYRLSEKKIRDARHNAFRIKTWPLPKPSKNDLVIACGYPGMYRIASNGQYDVAFVWFACRIQSVSNEKFGVSLNLKSSRLYRTERVPENADLGGCSGGPIFRICERPVGNGILTKFELIGIIFEYSPAFELLYAHPLSSLDSDGKFS